MSADPPPLSNSSGVVLLYNSRTARPRRELMAPKNPKDKEPIGRIGEAGLFLVSDRTVSWEWDSFPRRDPKAAWERLGPIRSSKTRAKRWPEGKK